MGRNGVLQNGSRVFSQSLGLFLVLLSNHCPLFFRVVLILTSKKYRTCVFYIKKLKIPMWLKGMCIKTIKNQGALRFLLVRNAKRLYRLAVFHVLAIGSGKRTKPEFKRGKSYYGILMSGWQQIKCLREASKVCFGDAFVYQGSGMRARRLGAYKLPCRVSSFRQFPAYFCRR